MVQQYISTSTVNNVVLHVLHSLVMVAVVNRGQHPMKTVTKNVSLKIQYAPWHQNLCGSKAYHNGRNIAHQ